MLQPAVTSQINFAFIHLSRGTALANSEPSSAAFPAFLIAIKGLGKYTGGGSKFNSLLPNFTSPQVRKSSGLLWKGPVSDGEQIPASAAQGGAQRKTGFRTEGKGWKTGSNPAFHCLCWRKAEDKRVSMSMGWPLAGIGCRSTVSLHGCKGILFWVFKTKTGVIMIFFV